MTAMGMKDVEQVESIGKELKAMATQLSGVSGQVNAKIRQLPALWQGHDAQMFVNIWWPQHQKELAAAISAIDGLGQSALNNATEQRRASSVPVTGIPFIDGVMRFVEEEIQQIENGIHDLLNPGHPTGNNDPTPGHTSPPPPTPPATPAPAPSGTVPDGADNPYHLSVDAGGGLAGSHRSQDEAGAAYNANYSSYRLWDDGSPQGEHRYQCVSWAWYRMRELGYSGAQVIADGGELAGGLGGTTSTTPNLGAVMSYDGHVVIAEQISHSDSGQLMVRVSEMNFYNTKDYPAPLKFNDDRWATQSGSGTWTFDGERGSKVVTIANPSYQK